MKLRAENSASPAARILAAANKLFYLHGIRAVGVDAVAAEAGVSKRTLYNHYRTKDDLIAAYLIARFKQIAPLDGSPRDQILGYFDHLERAFTRPGFRGCPYVNAIAELSDPTHPAAAIAMQFKEQRRQWIRSLLERLGASDADVLATQIQLLAEGAVCSALVRGDPAVAGAARAAAAVLVDASIGASARPVSRPSRAAARSRPRDMPAARRSSAS